MKRAIVLLATSLLALAAVSANGQKKNDDTKNHFQNIEVGDFDVKEGVTFPPDNIKPMMDEIVSKLRDLKRFTQVLHAGETPTTADAPTIQLVGTVTKYQPGSRTKRWVVGLGAGKTRVVTHVKFVDKSTGTTLYETDASGAVSWGIFGGESKESLGGLGKEIAELAKKKFF